MARNFRRKQDEETNYWLSYSDMMAGLLLTFVLVIALTVLHANIQFDMKQQELLGKEKELFIQADAPFCSVAQRLANSFSAVI